jgi:hypothetical protein
MLFILNLIIINKTTFLTIKLILYLIGYNLFVHHKYGDLDHNDRFFYSFNLLSFFKNKSEISDKL